MQCVQEVIYITIDDVAFHSSVYFFLCRIQNVPLRFITIIDINIDINDDIIISTVTTPVIHYHC